MTRLSLAWAVAVATLLGVLGWAIWRVAMPTSGAAEAATPVFERIVAQAQIVPVDGIIEVRPQTAGRVLSVQVHPGDRVRADQLLAEIESDLQSAAVRQRRADIGIANERLQMAAEGVRPEEQAALKAAADAARQQAELARDYWQRQVQLHAQHFISEQAVTTAEHDLQVAEARAREARARAKAAQAGGRPQEIRAAREQLASADAAMVEGKVALARTRIVAPIAGVVMTRNVNPGDIIGSDVTTPTLFRLVDPERIEVRFEVEELLAPGLAVGQRVEYTLPGRQSVIGHGHVTRIAPQVEKRTIGADDARIRADSMVRPAWSDFTPAPGLQPLPVNYRLEARVILAPQAAAPPMPRS